jgi:hypothetical protein
VLNSTQKCTYLTTLVQYLILSSYINRSATAGNSALIVQDHTDLVSLPSLGIPCAFHSAESYKVSAACITRTWQCLEPSFTPWTSLDLVAEMSLSAVRFASKPRATILQRGQPARRVEKTDDGALE